MFTVWLNVGSPIINCDSVRLNFSTNGRPECKLDNGIFRYCKSFYLKTWLSSGQHNITIRVSDGLGGYKIDIILFTIQLGMYSTFYYFTGKLQAFTLQANHTGVHGQNGLLVRRVVVVEHLKETECVYSPSAEIITMINVMVNAMKNKVVMNSVVIMVRRKQIIIINNFTCISCRKTTLGSMGSLVQLQ